MKPISMTCGDSPLAQQAVRACFGEDAVGVSAEASNAYVRMVQEPLRGDSHGDQAYLSLMAYQICECAQEEGFGLLIHDTGADSPYLAAVVRSAKLRRLEVWATTGTEHRRLNP